MFWITFLSLCAWLLAWEKRWALAQTAASWQFPVDDGLTVNYIDTVILQWTSNFASPLLYMWCQNGTAGDNVVLGSQFNVQNSGKLGYVMNLDDPAQVNFPVACHAQLVPTANGAGVDSPVGITFTSQPNVAAKTVSLSSSTNPASRTTSILTGSSSLSSISSSQTSSKATGSQSTDGSILPTAALTNSTSSAPSTSNTGSSNQSTAINTDAKSSGNNNVGAIVGGVIGGAALICLIIFGTLFLRKYNRGERDRGRVVDPEAKRKTWWSGIPGMTRTNVYEVDGREKIRHEKEGTLPLHEKEASTKLPPVEME